MTDSPLQTSPSSAIGTQWIREWGLIVYRQAQKINQLNPQSQKPPDVSGNPVLSISVNKSPSQSQGGGLDLSQMRIRFEINQWELPGTPNNALIRVYNLSDQTAKLVQNEFARVMLKAGYQSTTAGIIFDGNIKMIRRGRENQTDTYLDILAADGDLQTNYAIVNKSLAAGATPQQQLDAAIGAFNLPKGYVPDLPKTALTRGKVLYGMARRYFDRFSDSHNFNWSVQNGQVVLIPLTAYRPGEAVIINSHTGMIGLPEQTEGGINVTTLLNPLMKVGQLVQIDNKSIQRAFLGGNLLFAEGRLEDLPGLLPKVTDDGFYMVYVVEHKGDTRGQEWYSFLTCLAVDQSAAQGQQVQAYG